LQTLKLAFHGANTDTDTDFLARILARKLRVSDVRMHRRVGPVRVGVGVGVRVGVCVGVGVVECQLKQTVAIFKPNLKCLDSAVRKI